MAGSRAPITARSPGGICCSRPRNGKDRCSASRTSSIAIGTSRSEGKGRKGDARPLHPPGEFWEYNDVRVNRLSLALLQRFRRPLPEVFAERIMQPIGASSDWSWHGYRTSMVEIDGRMMELVSGGSHWGGGIAIHSEDQARIGTLMLRRGQWENPAVAVRALDRRVADPVRAQCELWIAVVVEHRAQALCERDRDRASSHRGPAGTSRGSIRRMSWSR